MFGTFGIFDVVNIEVVFTVVLLRNAYIAQPLFFLKFHFPETAPGRLVVLPTYRAQFFRTGGHQVHIRAEVRILSSLFFPSLLLPFLSCLAFLLPFVKFVWIVFGSSVSFHRKYSVAITTAIRFMFFNLLTPSGFSTFHQV